MASFGGFPKISKNRPEFCVTIEFGPLSHSYFRLLSGSKCGVRAQWGHIPPLRTTLNRLLQRRAFTFSRSELLKVNLQNPGSSIEKSKNPYPGSSQVREVGFGSIWEEILTKWLENGPYELIFGPFGTETWSRVRFWGSRRSKMASFGGFAKFSKIARNFA